MYGPTDSRASRLWREIRATLRAVALFNRTQIFHFTGRESTIQGHGFAMSNEELLARVGQSKEETEFYTPMPEGYRKGHHKYVIVVGTVMSGLGKGIFASSLAKLMQDKGLKVAPIKMEGYYNIDSGTLNPYRHGEVFVLDDGMETDMDLGTYERMLDHGFVAPPTSPPTGKFTLRSVKKEREGGYLGRDVQAI